MVRITTDDRGPRRFDTDRDASRSFVCRPRWRGRGVQTGRGYRARPAVVSVSAVSSHSLVGDVLLRDGSTLRLETPAPEDFGHIKAFYDGRSSESRYFRFHGYGRADTVARSEAEAIGVDRLALIGRHDGDVVASASYNGLREKRVAEVAFAVADDLQGRRARASGIGRCRMAFTHRAGGGGARARVRASRVRTSGRTGRHRPRGWLCARRARTPGRGDATGLGDRSRAGCDRVAGSASHADRAASPHPTGRVLAAAPHGPNVSPALRSAPAHWRTVRQDAGQRWATPRSLSRSSVARPEAGCA